MKKVELWVPIIGTGTDEDPFRPDLPGELSWAGWIPCELDPASPRRGQPLNKHALMCVDAKEAPLVKNAIPAEKVPDEERLLVELCRCVERDQWARMTPEGEKRVRDIMRREEHRPASAGPEGRGMLKRLLGHLVRRGLTAEAAQAIVREHGR